MALAWIFFRATSLENALDLVSGLGGLSLAGLAQDAGAPLLACLIGVAIYPQARALLDRGLAASSRMPWQFYPLPLALFLALIIFAAPSGVPGFIYAGF